MSSYNFFATLYDVLTENVDYKVRSDYISDFFKTAGLDPKTIIDLACGTCSLSIPFAKIGINVIGVDLSPQMLSEAYSNADEAGVSLSLINSSMQEFCIENCADAVICSLDSINHLIDIDDVQNTFNNVYKSLKTKGMFIFDVNTIYKHNNVLANNTFIFDEEDYYLVWDNEQIDDREVRILLDFFVFNGESYDRYSEEFNERAYSNNELTAMLNNAGFNDIEIFDELTLNAPTDKSERIYFVCKKGL